MTPCGNTLPWRSQKKGKMEKHRRKTRKKRLCKHSNDLKGFVKGLMIESYIEGGNQKVDEHIYGKSITDPCLGWDDTEKLLHIIAEEA